MREISFSPRLTRVAQRLVPVALGCGVVLAVASLGAFAGGLWWVFDLLAALRVQYGFGFFLIGVILAVAGSRLIAMACLMALLVHAALVAPLFLDDPAPTREDAGVLRIMFLNTDIRGADIDLVVEDLRTARHDLVFLSAATDRWADVLGSADIPYSVAQARPRGTSLELLALVRHGVNVETTIVTLGEDSRSKAIETRVNLDDAPVRILAMHPVSPLTPERADAHAAQVEAIAGWARIQQGPVVIVGDLNATPWTPVFRRLLEDGDLVNSQVGFGLQATWPAWLGPFGVPIDHVLHNEQVTTLERRVASGYGSSHHAIHVSVARVASSD